METYQSQASIPTQQQDGQNLQYAFSAFGSVEEVLIGPGFCSRFSHIRPDVAV